MLHESLPLSGNMIYLEILGQRILVLNSLSTILPLLEAKASNNSDRLPVPALDMAGFGEWNFATMNNNSELRAHRRAFHHFMSQHHINLYWPILEQEALHMLRRLLGDSADVLEAARLFFGTSIMRTSYGAVDPTYNQGLIRDGETIVKGFSSAAAPGKMLVNIFPVLKYIPSWLPGAGWKHTLDDLAVVGDRVLNNAFNDAKARINTGAERDEFPCAVKMFLDEMEGDDENLSYSERERVARNAIAVSFVGGSDTVVTSARALIFAMASHPDVQRKAQAELDAVVGAERLPSPTDMDHLPYMQAIVKEIGRWHTVVPLGLPHASRDDDVFNGYFIPGKTILMPNVWAIMHDPEIFEDPDKFNPERYLKDGKIDPSVLDSFGGAFGFGRRTCPGRYFSQSALQFMAASLLAVFDIRPPRDEAGNPISMKMETSSNLQIIS
ncbi:cytochrome P450 [Coprinopsis marcescibilis]|uniref:Cytochrome P450 n=1 Tax=Coprinopsis marcescibilis TaxID=230819 RepID=A0A5C3KIZ4_COPMA|nr:cytochrome P450 [Coprinopsis marcescibilis]